MDGNTHTQHTHTHTHQNEVNGVALVSFLLTSLMPLLLTLKTYCSGVFIADFEKVNAGRKCGNVSKYDIMPQHTLYTQA